MRSRRRNHPWRELLTAAIALSLLALVAGSSGAQSLPEPETPDPEASADEAAEAPEPEEDEIETDRDSFTPATSTAGRLRAVVEAAYSYIDNDSVPDTHSFPELLVRLGVIDRVELRLGWNYETGGAGSPISGNVPGDFGEEEGSKTEHEHRLVYGMKARVSAQDGWIPASAVIVQGFTPTGGESEDTEMSATGVFGWTLPEAWVWDSAIRFSTSSEEEDDFVVWSPSTVVKVPLFERTKVHLEYFGIFSDGRDGESRQHFLSPGGHYLLTPDLEIGARFGFGLNDETADFFANAGIGYRF